jgi:hypothetical protein
VLTSAKNGATVLVNLEEGRYFGLNEVASRIWELIVGGATLAAIVQTIETEYDLPPTLAADALRRDVTMHIDRLRKAKLVAVTSDR